jgi:hypothetical protein
MSVIFYGYGVASPTTIEAGVGAASGSGLATGLSVTPSEATGSAAGSTSTAAAVGEAVPAPLDHHVALPREPVGSESCEC